MITANIIIKLLELKHQGEEWATFAELSNGTGFSRERRYMDFFALNTWPSKRFQAIGYEVKISRADFMNEVRKPEKRLFAETHCNSCYFAMPQGLVKIDEIPEGWGLLEVNAGGLREVKAAQYRTIEPYSMDFVAALARRSKDDKEMQMNVDTNFIKRVILLGEEQLTVKEAVERLWQERPELKEEAVASKYAKIHLNEVERLRKEERNYHNFTSRLRDLLQLRWGINLTPETVLAWLEEKQRPLTERTFRSLESLQSEINYLLEKEHGIRTNFETALMKPTVPQELDMPQG